MTRRIIPGALFSVAVCLVVTSGCDVLNPNRQLITRAGTTVPLAENSSEVEHLLSGQKGHDIEMEQFRGVKQSAADAAERIHVMATDPDHYSPGRKEFLLAMARQSGVLVPGNSYVRLLQSSGVRCNLDTTFSTTFIKVRITSGPLKGREGWVCEDDIQRTVALP